MTDFKPNGKCDSCDYSPVQIKSYTVPLSIEEEEYWICAVCARTHTMKDSMQLIRWGINHILKAAGK